MQAHDKLGEPIREGDLVYIPVRVKTFGMDNGSPHQNMKVEMEYPPAFHNYKLSMTVNSSQVLKQR